MPGKKKKYNARFPPRRIKKIMQSDEEVGKVAAPVPVIISRTLELFVDSLLTSAGAITAARQARTLTPSHLKQCIMNEPRFDFLQDLFVAVPDMGTEPESETEPGTPGTPVTPCITPQYPFPDSATLNEMTHRGRGRGRGRPRGRSMSRGRGEAVTMPDDSSLSPGTSSLVTGLPHSSLKRGRARGRPRKTPPGLEPNSRIRGDSRPSMSTSSFATDDEDDDSNEDDVLELDLECVGSSSEDDYDDEEEDHPSPIQGATRPGKSSLGLSKGDHLSAEANVSTATTRSPVPVSVPNSLPSAYNLTTLPQGIQITIPGVISSPPTSKGVSNPFPSNGAAFSRPSGTATGVPVSVITSTQEFKKGPSPPSPRGANKPNPPRVVEVDEDYDC